MKTPPPARRASSAVFTPLILTQAGIATAQLTTCDVNLPSAQHTFLFVGMERAAPDAVGV